MSRKLQVRVVSPWFGELETDDAFFSVNLAADQADALLCDWAPTEELFSFPGRKAWYCCEPACHFNGLGGGSWPRIRARLAPNEFLCHDHPDVRYRVPHVTHFEDLTISDADDRIMRAVSIVSNHGGSPWRRHRDLSFRNRFATHALVDLYGRNGWTRYRAGRLSLRRAPDNYRGEIPGDWPAAGKRDLMTGYHAAVCLENMCTPHYFTEKFVEAVCAGCVPVYRAHPSVACTFLEGAAWIDPTDYGNDPSAAIEAALAADRESYVRINAEWLRTSRELAATHHRAVFDQIARKLVKVERSHV